MFGHNSRNGLICFCKYSWLLWFRPRFACFGMRIEIVLLTPHSILLLFFSVCAHILSDGRHRILFVINILLGFFRIISFCFSPFLYLFFHRNVRPTSDVLLLLCRTLLQFGSTVACTAGKWPFDSASVVPESNQSQDLLLPRNNSPGNNKTGEKPQEA